MAKNGDEISVFRKCTHHGTLTNSLSNSIQHVQRFFHPNYCTPLLGNFEILKIDMGFQNTKSFPFFFHYSKLLLKTFCSRLEPQVENLDRNQQNARCLQKKESNLD